MKYISALLLAASFNLTAADDMALCKAISNSAGQVMSLRQRGVSMQAVMEVTIIETMRKIVIDAYSKQRYSTKLHKSQAIALFKDDWYLKCAKSK